MTLPNPLLEGFNPDPSVVLVDDDYYLVTSSFEYLPGIPVYHSRDLSSWNQIGHVAVRPGQLQMEGVPTGGGAWAPTIRWRDGRFYVVVADAMGRGVLLFDAASPEGPWSDGTVVSGVDGIDPDLVWDEEGVCYMTYSGLVLDRDESAHHGIQQVRVDLEAGTALEVPRSLWSGTGLMFPEAPHVYRIGDWWYLVIAEGGTERGHCVSVARGSSPMGPFTGCPDNPVLSARSTARPVQNTGHGDLVRAPDGTWKMLLLGMHTRGMTRAFSALGRQTFVTEVDWLEGWPIPQPVELPRERPWPVFRDEFAGGEFGPSWISIRRFPDDCATRENGALKMRAEDRTMDHQAPTFVGRRVGRLNARIRASVLASDGIGGLTIRYDENNHYDVELAGGEIVARARIASMTNEKRVPHPGGRIVLFAEARRPEKRGGWNMTSDIIGLGYENGTERHEIAAFDGRYLTAETTCSFTGRAVGIYNVTGELAIDWYEEGSSDG